jgi:hypothetical protein
MNKLLKIINKSTTLGFKNLPFKAERIVNNLWGDIMRNLLRPIISTVIVASLSAPAWATTPVSLEEKQVNKSEPKVEAKQEEKKVVTKKVAKKPRLETLPNGQKVKVFPGAINEMPKEVGVQYVTEEGYRALLKQAKENKNVIKPVAATPVKMETVVVEEKGRPVAVPAPEVDAVPVTSAPPTASQAIIPPASPVTLHPVEQDPTVVVKPVDLSTLPPAATPVKAQETSDPLPMIPQHPAPVVQAPVVAPVPTAPVAATPVSVETTDTKTTSVPKVTISQEQREAMKKQLTEEFSNISIEDANANLSQKVLEEQRKIEETIQAKAKAEADAKAQAEADAKALQAAQEEKEYRENAPLAEDSNATPARAYTEEELKPVRLDKKNKNIVIELPKQRLNAYLTGAPMPKVDTLEQQQLDEQRRGQRLEENSDMEEVSGPNYGNIDN